MIRRLGITWQTLALVASVSIACAAHAPGAEQAADGEAASFDGRLLSKADLRYAGAFKLPSRGGGDGKNKTFGYSPGVIAYDAERDCFFIAGHRYLKGVAEVSNPGLGASTSLKDLPRAEFQQNFHTLIHNMPSGNPDGLGELGGLYVENGRLLFTAYEFYDADAGAKEVFGVLTDVTDLAQSPALGFFETGHGAHTAGWVSPVPPEHQAALKGTHIMASGQSQSIAGRWPLRPAAFSFNGADVFASEEIPDPLPVTPLIDGNLKHQLPEEMWNKWLDEAHYGIVVPDTGTYIAFGGRGGMHSKIGYKITTDAGRKTGGYAAQDDDDHYMYYWMFRVEDMARAGKGEIKPHEVVPYEHGRLALPFLAPRNGGSIGGGSWDPDSETVYLLLRKRDKVNKYTTQPIVVGVRFAAYDDRDETAPYGTMIEPRGGAKLSGQVRLEAHAIDNVDADEDLRVQFTVNGEAHGDPAASFPFRCPWDTTTVADGSYKVSAVARDQAGNERGLGTVTVTVANGSP